MKRVVNFILKLVEQKWWVFVILAMLTTLVLTLFMGKGQDVWFDESYSIILAKQPIDQLLSLTSVDAHPPLFYLLLKAWGEIFGWSELALRSFSAILAALTVGVIALLVRTLFTIRVALVALPFVTLAPFWLRYGYEIRMYALAGLICALASFVLIKAVQSKNDWRWWAGYALLVAAAMYTLYMTVVIWLAHFIWLMMYHRRHFWRQSWFRAYVVAVILFIPYIPTLIFQFTHSALPGIGQRLNLTHIGEIASQLLAYTPEWSVGGWSALGIVVTLGLSLFLIDRARHLSNEKARRQIMFLVLLIFVPLIFFIIISLPPLSPIFVPRYLAHLALFMYLLIGIAVALGWRYGYRLSAAVLFVTGLSVLIWGNGQLAIAGNFNYERMQRPQTVKVRQLIDCNKSVVVADDAYTYINNLYYFNDCDMRFYSQYPIRYEGGYAWLANSNDRLASSKDVTAETVVHLYWSDHDKTFVPDNRYQLVTSVTYDKQVTDTYRLISE